METSSILRAKKFSGIDNVSDDIRFSRGSDGMEQTFLTGATNVNIDNTGIIKRRSGFSKIFNGHVHSLWSDGEERCYFMKDGTMYRLLSDYRTIDIIPGFDPGPRMVFLKINSDVYFTNQQTIGFLNQDDLAVHLTAPTEDFKSPLPPGQILEYYNARLYVARESNIYFSDPVRYQYYDTRHNFISMGSTITMMIAVQGGMYVSDLSGVYFLAGGTSTEFVRSEKLCSAAIPGSSSIAKGIGEKSGLGEPIAVFTCLEGIMAGLPGGHLQTLQDKYTGLWVERSTGNVHYHQGFDQYLLLVPQTTPTIEPSPVDISIGGIIA